jgi:hypothetical protein
MGRASERPFCRRTRPGVRGPGEVSSTARRCRLAGGCGCSARRRAGVRRRRGGRGAHRLSGPAHVRAAAAPGAVDEAHAEAEDVAREAAEAIKGMRRDGGWRSQPAADDRGCPALVPADELCRRPIRLEGKWVEEDRTRETLERLGRRLPTSPSTDTRTRDRAKRSCFQACGRSAGTPFFVAHDSWARGENFAESVRESDADQRRHGQEGAVRAGGRHDSGSGHRHARGGADNLPSRAQDYKSRSHLPSSGGAWLGRGKYPLPTICSRVLARVPNPLRVRARGRPSIKCQPRSSCSREVLRHEGSIAVAQS